MPLADLASTENALEQFIREGRSTRQANRSAVLLTLIEKEQGHGKNCAFDVTVGTGIGRTYTDGEDVVAFSDDVELLASLDWGIYGDAFGLTSLAESASANSRTELGNMFVKKVGDCADRTASKMNIDMYSGDGTGTALHGMTAASGPIDATGTYAGINRATYSQWASNVDDNGGVLRPLSTGLMEKQVTDIYTASGRDPDILVTTPKLWQAYAELLGDQRRYVSEIEVRGEVIKLDGGFRALSFGGRPLFKDKDCPAGSMLFLCKDLLKLKWMAPNARVKAKDLAMIPIAGTPEEQATTFGRTPVMARVRSLAESGDYSRFQLVSWIQLINDRPNAHAHLKDLASN